MSSSIFSSRPRLFVVAVVAAVLGLGAAGALAGAYFTMTGDLLDERAVARLQRESGAACTYVSLAESNHAAYKLAAFEDVSPGVVALGSSRVLEFHGRMFDRPFYNLGRAMNDLADGAEVLRRMERRAVPEVVLLGVDYWLFSPNYNPPAGGSARPAVDPADPVQLFRLVGALWKSPELAPDPWDLITKDRDCPIGVAAKRYRAGFGADGFYYYGDRVLRPQGSIEDYQFRDSLARARHGARRFEHGDEPDPARIEALAAIVRALEARGAKVIVFAPPVAPRVAQEMADSGRYGYVSKSWSALMERGVPVHDFHDPASLDLQDCEFIDGFHAGDAAFGRLLQALAVREPMLRPYVDSAELERLSAITGRAAVYLQETFGIAEPDFLGLGCPK